jgi:hypothetical protein
MPPADSTGMQDDEFDLLPREQQRTEMARRQDAAEEWPQAVGHHPLDALAEALPMRTKHMRDEIKFWEGHQDAPSEQWTYTADQFRLKTWLSHYADYGEIPDHLKRNVKLLMESEKLLDDWKASRNPEQWKALKKKDRELNKEEIEVLLEGMEKPFPHLLTDLENSPDPRSWIKETIKKYSAQYLRDTERMADMQEVLKDPILEMQLTARRGLTELLSGDGNLGPSQAAEPEPSRPGSTTSIRQSLPSISRSLPGLRGAFTPRRPTQQQVPQRESGVEPAPSVAAPPPQSPRDENSAGSTSSRAARREGETVEDWRKRLQEQLADDPAYVAALARRAAQRRENEREGGMEM